MLLVYVFLDELCNASAVGTYQASLLFFNLQNRFGNANGVIDIIAMSVVKFETISIVRLRVFKFGIIA